MSTSLPEMTDLHRARYQDVGLLLGPLIFLIMMLLGNSQTTMEPAAWRVAAVGMWMAVWWATEAVPVPVTAFIYF
jgi:sodium-dependent dicarboxylate transporter 2/3/5